MPRMKAIRSWRGQEGRVTRGETIEVSESRARQLEGYEQNTGRILSATRGEEEREREIKTSARAVRIDEPAQRAATKGGATASEEKGRPEKAPESRESDADEGRADAEGTVEKRERADERPREKAPAALNATPGARTLADQYGVDLRNVRATGAQGRIIKADVSTYLGHDVLGEN